MIWKYYNLFALDKQAVFADKYFIYMNIKLILNFSSAKTRSSFITRFVVTHINIPFDHKNLAMVKFRRISGIIKEGFRPLIIHQYDVFSSKHHKAYSIEQLYRVFHHHHHEGVSCNDGFQNQHICLVVYLSANFLVHT